MKAFSSAVVLFSAVLVMVVSGCGKKSAASSAAGQDTLKSTDTTIIAADQIPDTSLTYEQLEGRQVFTKYCAVCHGDDGKGDGFNAYNLNPKPRDFTDAHLMTALSDERIFKTISEGGRNVNRSILMPSWEGRLSRSEINYVISYVRLFGGKR
jgi:mono/diheme cytochrome c family protein